MLELLDLRNRRERLEPRHLEVDPGISATVAGLIERVRTEGDSALLELTLKFDGADLRDSGLVVTPDEFLTAREATPEPLRDALDALIERLESFHARQLPPAWQDERDGVRFGEIVRPLRAAGCYVPGGRASYPSSVAMTVIPARVAGVEEIVVCTPPDQDGSLAPPVLYAAERAGATKVVKVGGAQAIAAMAFGTGSVPAVDRIAGPGNAYVTEAKRQLVGGVGIDGLAGPTELVVVTDSDADVRTLTADLIAQAEHDPAAIAILVTTDPAQVDAVRESLHDEALRADRREIVEEALSTSRAIVVGDMAQAVEVVNDLAPEHLQLLLKDARPFAEGVRNAGAIFVGLFTAVPFGDYGVASNHVLPTAGTARFASGLRASDFVTVSSVVEVDADAAKRLAPEVATIARSEGLSAHARAVEVRTESATEAKR
ncbi:MAG: histidinol dehydrogenase [Actinomycetota bacterium]|nr:histidinol dehydrogenase [Actinomycetota bacterium]